MSEITDLHLHHSAPGNDRDDIDLATNFVPLDAIEQAERSKWIVLIVLLLIAIVSVGYIVLRRSRAPAPQIATAPVASAPAQTVAPKTGGPLVEAEKIALPALPETDALVRELVVKLSSHPKALAWLATNGLIENFTVATLNVSEGKTPVVHWPTLAPRARFNVLNTPRGVVVDPKSYQRYDEYAAAVGKLDPAGTARLYLTLKPRIIDAYRGLGFPEGDFDPVLERAIGVLLATPAIDGDVALREKVITYQFVDPEAEALPGAAKQLLRMGPNNLRIVQAKLRELVVQLGLHPAK
jgi:Protein of unknown function (DUF3014)